MNRILISTGILLALVITSSGATTVKALSPYDSGYKHGVSDGKLANKGLGGSDWYITQPGKGFAFHTQQFNQGYIDGFCSVSSGGSDADQATFDCATDTSQSHR